MKNRETQFSEWLAKNNYVLRNKSNGMYLWENEDGFVYWNDLNAKQVSKCKMKDTIVESVIEQFKQRSEAGINKYGVTLDREDLNVLEWLQHLQEELMDATLYVQKLKEKLNDKE